MLCVIAVVIAYSTTAILDRLNTIIELQKCTCDKIE